MTSSHVFVELNHVVRAGMITYPGLPAPVITPHLTRDQSPSVYAPGTEFAMDLITMIGNTGTYLDSPDHRFACGTPAPSGWSTRARRWWASTRSISTMSLTALDQHTHTPAPRGHPGGRALDRRRRTARPWHPVHRRPASGRGFRHLPGPCLRHRGPEPDRRRADFHAR